MACGAALQEDGGSAVARGGAPLRWPGGSAGPQGENGACGRETGGNSDSGGPADGLAGGNASGGLNGLRARMRRPHASQN